MYDAFRSRFRQDNRKYFNDRNDVELFGLQFKASFNSEGNIASFSVTHYKIRVEIKKYEIVFSGSFHTSCKGHNAGVFLLTELAVLFRILRIRFGVVFMKSRVTKLEWGVITENDEVNYIYYKSAFSEKMRDKQTSKVYGQKLVLSDFEIKRYDKLLQMTIKKKDHQALPEEGIRIEVKVKRMRSIQKAKNPVPIYLIEDLIIKDNIKAMHEYFKRVIHRVVKQSTAINALLENDRDLMNMYAVMSFEQTNKLLRKTDRAAHKSNTRKLKNIMNKGLKDYNSDFQIKLDKHLNVVLS